ncbi:MAG: ATP phosphoribosyltransferase regulatory subunit [Bacilli bacterium]
MKNYMLHTSEGVRDFFGNELKIKEKLIANIKSSFSSFGYKMVQTPTFEYIDVFSVGKNTSQKPSLYNLINRDNEILALRSDMTASIARFVSSKDSEGVMPKRYFYVANTFRYPKVYQGASHEFTQAGIELIGKAGIKADLEVLKIALASLKENFVNSFSIHIGSVDFIETLLTELRIEEMSKREIYKIIEAKDFVTLKEYLDSLDIKNSEKELIIELMQSAGRINFIRRLKEKIAFPKTNKVLCELEEFYLALEEIDMAKYVLFDFSIYSYAKYYNKIIFQIFVKGIADAIIEGGRYDNLLSHFGADLKAIGFGLNIDLLLEYIIQNDLIKIEEEIIVSFYDKVSYDFAYRQNKILRKDKIVIDSLEDSLEETIAYAKKIKAKKVISYENNKEKIINL